MLIKRYIVYEFLFENSSFVILSAIASDNIIKEELNINGKTATGVITLPIEISIESFFNSISIHLKKLPNQNEG